MKALWNVASAKVNSTRVKTLLAKFTKIKICAFYISSLAISYKNTTFTCIPKKIFSAIVLLKEMKWYACLLLRKMLSKESYNLYK